MRDDQLFYFILIFFWKLWLDFPTSSIPTWSIQEPCSRHHQVHGFNSEQLKVNYAAGLFLCDFAPSSTPSEEAEWLPFFVLLEKFLSLSVESS